MSTTWAAYRRARRQSRQAWVLLILIIAACLAGIGWFFTNGQFAVGEEPGNGPTGSPAPTRSWMKPVEPTAGTGRFSR